MPVIKSAYRAPFLYRNSHVATIYPSLFRKVAPIAFERERIDTRDGDFLDLDWFKQKSKRLLVLSHGLEGSSTRPYVLGGAQKFIDAGWDVVAWNCRSCSGEMNKLKKLYHHGMSEDLDDVVLHAGAFGYKDIFLGGYSLGGSLTVKYLGTHEVPQEVRGGVAVSVPFSIKGSATQLSKKRSSFYRTRFIKKLKEKIRRKAEQFPEISVDGIEKINSFRDFDNRFTAPLHGFKDADDFYDKASAGNYLPGVKVPLLVINATNDPFLNEDCYPVSIAEQSANIFLEMPRMGGHVGFLLDRDKSWIDHRMLEFAAEVV